LSLKKILNNYLGEFKTEITLEQDLARFFLSHKHAHSLSHSLEVASEAETLAKRFQCNPTKAKIAGYLHDISAVVPNSDRIALSEQLGIDILKEERALPMIIHQKLSVVIARELFDIKDSEILSAIACHTTLKAKSSVLDKVVFVADKIRWDGTGQAPYLNGILEALDNSLDAACFYYINYLYKQKNKLKVIHPFLAAAYHELKIHQY